MQHYEYTEYIQILLCLPLLHFHSCPEEQEEGKIGEFDEDRRIAEAKACKIQKCQGTVPFLLL